MVAALTPSAPGQRHHGRVATSLAKLVGQVPSMFAKWNERKALDVTIPVHAQAVIDGQVPRVSTESPALFSINWRERAGTHGRRTFNRNYGTIIIMLYHYHDETSEDPDIASYWLLDAVQVLSEEINQRGQYLRMLFARISSGVPGLSSQPHVMQCRLEIDAVVAG
jgi:hypothetical protein